MDTTGWLQTPTTIFVRIWHPQGYCWMKQMDCMDLCSESYICTYMHTHIVKKHYNMYCNSGVFSSGCFALQKLKKGVEEGAFLICWSAVNYENLVLIVYNKNMVILKKLLSRDIKKETVCLHVIVSYRMAQHRTTSSFRLSTRIQSSVWMVGTNNTLVWGSSQTVSRTLCSCLVRKASLSRNAVYHNMEVCS